jgi:hypothetical protein
MSDLTRHAFVSVLVLCCVGFCFATRAQTTASKNVPQGSVSGRVTIEGKGRPGVVISLRRREFAPRRVVLPKATTDEDGNYSITRVPPGQYLVFPAATVFVFADFGDYSQRGKSLTIAEGEEVTGFDFGLVHGGVITGKITDAEGRPLIEERVRLISTGGSDPPRSIYPADFRTDDRGIYRMFGVRAGTYHVVVGEAEATSRVGPATFGRRPVKQTFHPGTSDESKAALIKVTESEEISNIDITVGSVLPTFTATGRMFDGETGLPIAGASYNVGKSSMAALPGS